MKKNKAFHTIKLTLDAYDKLIWAKRNAMSEQKKLHNKEIIVNLSESIVWMYDKIQELSKVLKDKLEEEKRNEK
jgi:hypothetical protein